MRFVRLSLALSTFLLTTSPSLADDIFGTWLRDNGALQVKFEPCGDAICGNIVWVKPGSDSKAKVGQRLFFEMRPNGVNSWTGKAASPDSGSVYSGKMSIEGSGLNTSGCMVGGLICKSVNWKKIS
ncbi:DUF2147 domain-containing protein [Bradyrhizobium sp. Ash2021]|uniref:DUF2147 domain-containing protein n=1 Tax=Bradyrhizobium sp. Ash2021 TaxID=2954771 RepID=UPI0028162658|nr:DUF2147 domain-containing protein [Bradyrhizobium sp. Ash2021]WMT75543.1 DUF2147 domain-containing protein [Bradyrhizobium sp. Ash2021]